MVREIFCSSRVWRTFRRWLLNEGAVGWPTTGEEGTPLLIDVEADLVGLNDHGSCEFSVCAKRSPMSVPRWHPLPPKPSLAEVSAT